MNGLRAAMSREARLLYAPRVKYELRDLKVKAP